ncbi:MAG: flagellar export chaperone FliS [Caldilineaceae bacterium]
MYYPQQQRANHQYVETQVMSADPIQLVIMTYDVAISASRSKDMSKALQAVGELQVALNHEEGGQIAADLLSLYLYISDLLRKQNFEEAAKLLTELRQTWVQVRKQLREQMTAQEKPVMSMAA